MTVIYPVKPGTHAPEITRLDDYTVEVLADGERDVVSFDANTRHQATLKVDLTAVTAEAAGSVSLAKEP